MAASVTATDPARHRMDLERVHTQMLRADLKKVETRDFRAEIGSALGRAFALAGLSQKQVAAELAVDTAQIARWIAGTERPQFDRLFAVETLREPLVVALSKLADAAVSTRIEFTRRTA